MLPALISAAGSLGAGAFGLWSGLNAASTSRKINQQNIDFQRETNEHNEALMREAWSRDDSYYTRLTSDLANAGLNPAIAAQKSVVESNPITTQSPQASMTPAEMQARAYEALTSDLIQMTQNFADNYRKDLELSYKNKKTVAETESTNLDNEEKKKILGGRPNDWYTMQAFYQMQDMMNKSDILFSDAQIRKNKYNLSLIENLNADLQTQLIKERIAQLVNINKYYPWDKGFDYANKGSNVLKNLTSLASGVVKNLIK